MNEEIVVYVMHLIGIFMVFMGLAGAVMRSAIKDDAQDLKRMVGFTFGLGMILVFVGGIRLMMLRKYDLGENEWLVVKMVLWFVFAATFSLIIRKPAVAKTMWAGIIALGGIAVYMVYGRPW